MKISFIGAGSIGFTRGLLTYLGVSLIDTSGAVHESL